MSRKYFKREWSRGENSQSEAERLKVMQEKNRGWNSSEGGMERASRERGRKRCRGRKKKQ